jgi:TonB family protein
LLAFGLGMRARLISFFVHCLVVAVLLFFPWRAVQRSVDPKAALPPTRIFLPRLARPDRGRGGLRSLTPARLGQLPPIARRVFVPPLLVVRENPKPMLLLDAGLAIRPVDFLDVRLPQYGDPYGAPGPPGGGSGENGLDGPGSGGRGNRDGSGFDSSGGLSGPVVGPQVVFHPEPEFSEEARKAKLQGVVVLEIQVDAGGRARVIRVSQPLGLGLDEKAVEAVLRWRFRPATRNGRPVPANATIYVHFRLL